MRTALIFPGYPFSCQNGQYKPVVEKYEEEGFEVDPVDIDWGMNLRSNMKKADEILVEKELGNDEIHFFGHSWGAVCALWAARNYEAETQVLASLSPELEEDVAQLPYYMRKLSTTIRRIEGIMGRPGKQEWRPSFRDFSTEDNVITEFLYGRNEYSGYFSLKSLGYGSYVSDKRLEMFPNSSETVVEGAGHRLNSNYLDAIEKTIEKLV